MQQRGGQQHDRTRYRASTVFRPFVPAVLLLVFTLTSVHAAGYKGPRESALEDFGQFDESLVEKWKEVEAALPAYPEDRDLIAVRMPVTYTVKVFIDEKSVFVGTDNIARFTLVVETATGHRNVFFEGYDCETRMYKTYAFGTPDRSFDLVKKPGWERVPYYETNAFRFQLQRYYLCHPDAASLTPSARELVHRLRSSMNE